MDNLKVAFFDVDGTIVDNKLDPHKVTEMELVPKSTVGAIKCLGELGVTAFIATGRSPFMIEQLLSGLEIESYICNNGQYAVMNGEVIYDNPFDRRVIEKVNEISYKYQKPVLWMLRDSYVVTGQNQDVILNALSESRLPKPDVINSIDELNVGVYQIVMGINEGEEYILDDLLEAKLIRWHRSCVDIVPKHGSKASTISVILEKLNLTCENAIAFGDGLNDLEMLKAVKLGVAMGNAHEITKSNADYVTKAVHEDGIEYALKHFKIID